MNTYKENNMNLPINYKKATWAERRQARIEYGVLQKGMCQHCGNDLTQEPTKEVMEAPINWKLFPTGFLDYPIHLHHNHVSGLTIGAVHARCNAYLWQFKGE
jgi:hypothetical protein